MALSYLKIFTSEAEKTEHSAEGKSIVNLQDLDALPEVVRKYLLYTGVVGKEIPQSVHFKWKGYFKTDRNKKWAKIKALQFNSLAPNIRCFYMDLRMMGLPVKGLHLYKNAVASMKIKIVGLFQVVDAHGFEMNKGETVTFFNDMCFFCPAWFLKSDIQWEELDSLRVNATYTNNGMKISATLIFNPQGQLINFISNDRYLSSDGKTYLNYPWTTPVGDYKESNGRMLPSYGEATWITPDGEFCYGKFYLDELIYK